MVIAKLHALTQDGSVFAVKDSFSNLDLSTLGFEVLFDADWIWRDPEPQQLVTSRELRWTKVLSLDDLEHWENGWHPDRGLGSPHRTVYGTALLFSESFSFVSAYSGSELVAGAALAVTEGTVGVACTFFRGPNTLDRVNRQFRAERPNQLRVSDFTYVSTWQGWLYVAFVIDVFTRRIVG